MSNKVFDHKDYRLTLYKKAMSHYFTNIKIGDVMRATRTGSLTTAAINFLTLIGFHAWENKTVGIWDPTKEVFRKPKRSIKGASDIMAVDWHGRVVCVEIKSGEDRLSADQTIFAAEIIGRGGIYLIVSQIQDLIDGLIFFGYDLNDNGYVKSKNKFDTWKQRNAINGRLCIPNSNKIRNLSIEEKARISIAIATEGLKTDLAKVFHRYAERIYG